MAFVQLDEQKAGEQESAQQQEGVDQEGRVEQEGVPQVFRLLGKSEKNL